MAIAEPAQEPARTWIRTRGSAFLKLCVAHMLKSPSTHVNNDPLCDYSQGR